MRGPSLCHRSSSAASEPKVERLVVVCIGVLASSRQLSLLCDHGASVILPARLAHRAFALFEQVVLEGKERRARATLNTRFVVDVPDVVIHCAG